MSIQNNVDYHAQSLADKALSAKDPRIVQTILGDLTKSIQDGAVKPYVGIPLIQSINQHLQGLTQQANMMAALRTAPQVPPAQSIGAQTLGTAETSPGITSAPSNLPTQMASGGIVAFENNQDQPVSTDMPSSLKGGPTLESQPWYSRYKARVLKAYGDTPTINPFLSGMPRTDLATEYKTLSDKSLAGQATQADYARMNQITFPPGINTLSTPGGGGWTPDQVIPPSDIKEPAKKVDTTDKYFPDTTTKQPAEDPYLKMIQDAVSKSESDRAGLKQLILGDEDERARDKKIDLLTSVMGAGFKAAATTSPYTSVGIGEGGQELAKGIAGIQERETAAKQNRINQLVQLGLKGSELDMELAKVGISAKDAQSNAAYRAAHAAVFPSEITKNIASAYHLTHPTGTYGAVPQKLMDARQQDLADPASSQIWSDVMSPNVMASLHLTPQALKSLQSGLGMPKDSNSYKQAVAASRQLIAKYYDEYRYPQARLLTAKSRTTSDTETE